MRLLTLLAVLAAAGCATTRAADQGERMVISIRNLACGDCGKELEAAAETAPGVRKARFNMKTAELELTTAPGTDPAPVLAGLNGKEIDGKAIEARLGAGAGAYAAFTTPDPSWDVRVLSVKGEDVPDIATTVAVGKVTVVDFYADWCGPCHALDEHIHELLSKDSKLAYRRINVVDWESAVARHYLASAKGLPYLVVFDTRGKEAAALSGPSHPELDAAIQKAAR